MIPSNAFTPVPDPAPYLPPYDLPFTKLEHVVRGGIAIGDASKGRDYQNWQVRYQGGNIEVLPVGGSVAFSMTVAGVQTLSLAFDNNMGIVLCWMASNGANLYYFNTLTAAYTTRNFNDITSCRVVVDDGRDFYTAASDVIFGYTRAGNLYWRQQRDRYDVEYLVGPTANLLVKMAPNINRRLQFALLPQLPTT